VRADGNISLCLISQSGKEISVCWTRCVKAAAIEL
jgi:hypothetical protein